MRAALVLLVAFGASTAVAGRSPIRVWESTDDASITEGETTLDVDPDTAYAAATDYQRWSVIFPDIERVIVTKQQGDDARVTLIHRDGNRDNVHFHNTPQARMVWFEDTGGTAEVWAEIVFIPGVKSGTTRVHSRVFASVHGVAGVFVGADRVKNLRTQRVRSDLHDLQTFFSKH